MKKIEIIEQVIILLLRGSIPYSELLTQYFQSKGVKKSELSTCIKDLKNQGFIDYEGNFDDNNDVVMTRLGEEKLFKYGSYAAYLKSQNVTKYDELVRWGKNNIIIVFLMLSAVIIAVISKVINNGKDIVNALQTTETTNSLTHKTIPEEKSSLSEKKDSVPLSLSHTLPSGSSHVTIKEEKSQNLDNNQDSNYETVLSLTPTKLPYSCGYLSPDEKEWIITNCDGYSSEGGGTGTLEKVQTILPIGEYIVIYNVALGRFIPKDDINSSIFPSSDWEDFNISFKVLSDENNNKDILAQQVLPYTHFSSNFKEVKLKFKLDEVHSRNFLSFPIYSTAVSHKLNEIRVKGITIKRIL